MTPCGETEKAPNGGSGSFSGEATTVGVNVAVSAGVPVAVNDGEAVGVEVGPVVTLNDAVAGTDGVRSGRPRTVAVADGAIVRVGLVPLVGVGLTLGFGVVVVPVRPGRGPDGVAVAVDVGLGVWTAAMLLAGHPAAAKANEPSMTTAHRRAAWGAALERSLTQAHGRPPAGGGSKRQFWSDILG